MAEPVAHADAAGLAPSTGRGASIARVEGFPASGGVVDLDVRVGDVVVLRGGNGSGKTSLLRSIAGLASPITPASVAVSGESPATVSAKRLAGAAMFALQDPAETLTGLTVAGEFRLRGRGTPPGLADLAERDVVALSSGEARRVSIGVVSGGNARLLLLDEPMEGLDDAGRRTVLDLVTAHARTGAAIVADHSDDFAGIATCVVDLGAGGHEPPAAMPVGAGAIVLQAPATLVQRSGRTIVLPAVRLGPGFHLVRGPNASGKSTLLLHLAGLLGPGALVAGFPANPGHNVHLLLPRAADLFTHESVSAELGGAAAVLAAGLIASALLGRHPLSLSAGEAQRVALAKCLGRAAPVYLLDEPEAHLDRSGRAALIDAIAKRVAEGACVLAASHDLEWSAHAQSVMSLGPMAGES